MKVEHILKCIHFKEVLMKRALAIVLAFVMMLSVFGASAVAESAVSGTFTGTARAMKGDLTVEVDLDNGTITDVRVVDTVDTLGIKDAAIASVPKRIVEQQNIDVDAVTGATMTSFGIKGAVKAALTEAGVDLAQYQKGSDAVTEKQEAETQTADIVIVGSGISGLSASIEAKRTNPDLNVVVLERNAYTGGSSRVCGGGIWVVGSEHNKEVEIDPTLDEFIDFFQTQSGENAELNTELMTNIYNISAKVFDYFYENGLPTDPAGVSLGHPDSKLPVFWSTFYKVGRGGESQYVDYVQKMAEALDVDIRLENKVLSLVTDGKTVTGVQVETPDSFYQLNASKVILCTGGFTQNRDLIGEYAPDYLGSLQFTGPGGKGDGHKWAVELGGEVFGTGMMGLQGFNLNIGYYGEVGTLSGNPDLIVNLDTERFEFASLFYGYKLKQLLDQPDSQAVGIYGTTEERQEALEKGVTMGWIKKFDTMEDLAAEFKLDTEKLESAAAEAELAGAPYYAATIRPLFIGSIPGLRVDANCRVLANGEPIENLYAAGELIFSNVFQDHYPASGSGMGTSTYTGAIAADTAIGDM